jgi:hypothetical protein
MAVLSLWTLRDNESWQVVSCQLPFVDGAELKWRRHH